ncbi:hypothetical protein E2C01_003848 [Portunus trituberculatus]|uniref:Uncharacterized protein n=1 Tax=Portunus trituberculatus TaxID=210409 RepID=A0A5B7CP15_PORTR|nr:hypothetical protein [Portunus trituberculatus]
MTTSTQTLTGHKQPLCGGTEGESSGPSTLPSNPGNAVCGGGAIAVTEEYDVPTTAALTHHHGRDMGRGRVREEKPQTIPLKPTEKGDNLTYLLKTKQVVECQEKYGTNGQHMALG